MKQKYDKLVSRCASKFNLRPYIKGILDNVFFRGYFYGEAEIQKATDVGLPAGADVSATVAVSFSAMNPPMDFQLEEMIIEAEFNMQVENVIKIHGRGERSRWQPPKILFRISAADPQKFRDKFRMVRPNFRESTRKFPNPADSAQIRRQSAKLIQMNPPRIRPNFRNFRCRGNAQMSESIAGKIRSPLIHGEGKFVYPLRTPIPVTAWVDFDFKIPGINFPRLEANITIYPDDVPAAVKKSRVLTASLRAVTPFGFTYAGIDAEVSSMVATLTVFDNGRIEGSFTAKPSLSGGNGGGAEVNVDMVIIAKFWMDRGDAFNMDAELSVEASLDIEDRFFGIHLSGGAATTCKPKGLNLQGTFWFMIPGVADSRLDGVVSVVKLCGDYFGSANSTGAGTAIPMISATVGIPEWSMGAGGKTLKDLFVHVYANPGRGVIENKSSTDV